MKKYTQADFDAFEVIDGIKQCPSGDYSDIRVFGKRCSFGNRCSFGERCSFGRGCSFEDKGEYIGDYPFLAFVGFGSRIGSKVLFLTCKTAFMSVRLLAVGYSLVPGEGEGEEYRCDVPGFVRSGREEV